MFSQLIVAATQSNIDPETLHNVTMFTLGFMVLMTLVIVGLIVWHFGPDTISYLKNWRAEKVKSATSISFNSGESELHHGHKKIRIEPNSLEYFVCKIVLRAPSKYRVDVDIFEQADKASRNGSKETNRGVEQAVRRLNKKARTLGLQNDLFKRSKESTSVNNEYRQNILKD